MTPEDKAVIEDIVMSMTKYIRDMALWDSFPEGVRHDAIEQTWDHQKQYLARLFTRWNS